MRRRGLLVLTLTGALLISSVIYLPRDLLIYFPDNYLGRMSGFTRLIWFVFDEFFDAADNVDKSIVVVVTYISWNNQHTICIYMWFLPRDAKHSAAYAIVRWLAVRPSVRPSDVCHLRVLSENGLTCPQTLFTFWQEYNSSFSVRNIMACYVIRTSMQDF